MTPRNIAEFVIRRFYFSRPELVEWYQRQKTRALGRQSRVAQWDRRAVRSLLDGVIPHGPDIMLHCSMAGLGQSTSPLDVLNLFLEFCGDTRTLLLPSHPRLRSGKDGVLEYDPQRSPSTVGLVSELARRSPGFLRSRYPTSAVTAWGPRASFYLADNLNTSQPLPHGIYSPYARLAEADGYAVCLGVPFDKALTVLHVSEETLDQDFPYHLIFETLPVRIVEADHGGTWTVRRRSARMLPFFSVWSIKRDLPAIGAVRRFDVGGILVDVADCSAIVRFMRARALKDGYPYMFLRRRS